MVRKCYHSQLYSQSDYLLPSERIIVDIIQRRKYGKFSFAILGFQSWPRSR